MKAKKRAGGKAYIMPIPHDRFAHMLTALLAHIHHLRRLDNGAALDEATTREIADALYKLRTLYCEETLRHTLPNRRENPRDLQDAVNAQALVDFYSFNRAGAMEAIASNPHGVERDSVARTQRNRNEKARLLGVEPDWKVIATAAKKTKKKTKKKTEE